MKVCFETFGCRLNKAEALQMEAEYLSRGWELIDTHSEADLFVVRGCSVTARAQHECEKLLAHLRRRYPTTPIRVCGCIDEAHKALKKLSAADSNRPQSTDVEQSASQAIPTRTARAYLKVQDGCAGKCTFCIVPKFRGASVSMHFNEVLDRARRFIDAGYHEIVVTGCNLSLYASGNKRLPELLADLAELSTDCRIRLGSLEPGACALETVSVFAEHANICRYLHIPAQSGSNRILMAMRRPYLTHDVDALVAAATERMPLIGLSCDLMTGFPDETEIDFNATRGLILRNPFSNAHIFPYSRRPGTLAAAFGDQVPHDVRSARAHELSRIMREARRRFARKFVGKTVEIVVEEKDKTVGWTSEYLRCKSVSGKVQRKSSAHIFVTRTDGDRLYGHLA